MYRLLSSLRFQLLVIVLLSVLPAIALILYSGFESRTNAALQAREDTQRLVELASTHQAHVIDEAYRLLSSLAKSLPARMEDGEQCSAYLLDTLSRHPHYLNLGVIGPDGTLRGSALPFVERPDFSNSDYFRQTMEDPGLAIGRSRFEPATGKTSIDFGYPLQDAKGGVNAVVFASVDLGWLSDLAAYFQFAEGATLTVIDRGGTVLARYPDAERWVGENVSDARVLKTFLEKGGKGTVETAGIDGVHRLYAFTPLDDSPRSNILYTGIPTSTVYAGANRALTRNLVASGCITVVVILAACVFGHLMVMRRVNALMGTVARLEAGDLAARTGIPSGSSELRKLEAAFDAMAESLERKSIEREEMEEALRSSEKRYRTLVEQIPVVTYTATLEEPRATLFISPQVESLLGFDEADFYQETDTWSKRLHPEDRERVLRELSLCRKENDLFFCEYRMLTFNGFVKWIRDEAVIMANDAGGPLCIQGVMADITEQKRSEEELAKARNEVEVRVEQRTKELAKANEDLRQGAEKLKSFAASVVHDLKSPAIGAYGITKLLWKQYGTSLDEKGMHYCNQIMKASEHVVELAEKINAYIAAKESPLRIQPVQLGEILKVLREEFSSRLAARSVAWLEPEGDIVVRADRLSLLRMFRNCIDNSLKYGGEQLGQIRIEYEESDRFHIFSVSDDGQGVSEEDAQRLFQRFQRSSNPSGIEGAGLGLSIVRETAEKHGGEVSVKPGIRNGVTFTCSISKNL